MPFIDLGQKNQNGNDTANSIGLPPVGPTVQQTSSPNAPQPSENTQAIQPGVNIVHEDYSKISAPSKKVSQEQNNKDIVSQLEQKQEEVSQQNKPPLAALGDKSQIYQQGTNIDTVSQKIRHEQQGQSVEPRGENVTQTLSGIQSNIWEYLNLAQKREASDLHIVAHYPPLLRIDGKLERIGSDPLTSEQTEKLLSQVLTKEQKEEGIKQKEFDFAIQHKSGFRFRVNIYFERGNFAGSFRLIPAHIKTIGELGLPDILNDFSRLPHGLILVTGPSGSGKSTTIAALINEININFPKHIISVEDPIEYVYGRGKALLDQREVGRDTNSWKNALTKVLRQDLDVVLVGEMRDYETIAATMTVAETGHLVFATLHTNSAAQSVDRIIDVFPEHQQAQVRSQLAQIIQIIISQRLVPVVGGGRKPALEILIGTDAVKNAIREGKTYQIDNIIQTSADIGMLPLEKALANLVRSADITVDVALEHSVKPEQLKEMLNI